MLRLALAPVLTLCLLTAPAAMADDFTLFEMEGEWRGKGTIRAALDQPARAGRCKMQAEPLVQGVEMRLTGRCATQLGASNLTLQFALHDGGVIAGGVASPSLPETIQFIGQISGEVAELHSRDPVVVGETVGNLMFTITILDQDHFDLVEWFQPEPEAEKIELVRMQFGRAAGG